MKCFLMFFTATECIFAISCLFVPLSIRIYNADGLSISICNALTSDNPIEPS